MHILSVDVYERVSVREYCDECDMIMGIKVLESEYGYYEGNSELYATLLYNKLYSDITGKELKILLKREYYHVCEYIKKGRDKRLCEYGLKKRGFLKNLQLKVSKEEHNMEIPQTSLKMSAIPDKDFETALNNYMNTPPNNKINHPNNNTNHPNNKKTQKIVNNTKKNKTRYQRI